MNDYEKRKDDFVRGFIELAERTCVSLGKGEFNDMCFLDTSQKRDVKHLIGHDSFLCIWVKD